MHVYRLTSWFLTGISTVITLALKYCMIIIINFSTLFDALYSSDCRYILHNSPEETSTQNFTSALFISEYVCCRTRCNESIKLLIYLFAFLFKILYCWKKRCVCITRSKNYCDLSRAFGTKNTSFHLYWYVCIHTSQPTN